MQWEDLGQWLVARQVGPSCSRPGWVVGPLGAMASPFVGGLTQPSVPGPGVLALWWPEGHHVRKAMLA